LFSTCESAQPSPAFVLRNWTGDRFRNTVLDAPGRGDRNGRSLQALLDRHREQKEAEQIVKEARDLGLPPDARAKPWHRELSEWQVKLLRTTKDRLSDEDDYPLDTTRSTVKEAVAEITREFQAHQAAERDRELRERVKAGARYSIPFGLNDEGRELAIQAIGEGIDRLPPRTSKDKLEAAVDEALQPFRDAIREHAGQQRRRAESGLCDGRRAVKAAL
jgi:hypothetical protein